MTTRDELHHLIDELPENELPLYLNFFASLRHCEDDPLLRRLLLAPLDDEPETEEERQAVAEADKTLARGEVYTLDEVRRELGL